MAELKLSLVGLDKLIEVVAQGIGALAKPWMIRRVARARADGMRMLASAEVDIAQQLQLPSLADSSKETLGELPKLLVSSPATDSTEAMAEMFDKRIEQRISLREQRRQRNIEAIALDAAQEIAKVEILSGEAVDDAWIDRFFQAAQDIGDPELRRLWARILAREVAAPRSTTLRVLEVLRNLNQAEARMFQECICEICDVDELGPVIFVVDRSIAWNNRLKMIDCGLFGAKSDYQIGYGVAINASHGDLNFVFRAKSVSSSPLTGWGFSVIHLSEAGQAVYNLLDRANLPNA